LLQTPSLAPLADRLALAAAHTSLIFLLSLAVMGLMLHLLLRRLRPESSGQVKG
jgi:hypothetical protein